MDREKGIIEKVISDSIGWAKAKDTELLYSCFASDENEWNGQAASWLNARWTGVLEKRDGDWRIVQMHFSYGVET